MADEKKDAKVSTPPTPIAKIIAQIVSKPAPSLKTAPPNFPMTRKVMKTHSCTLGGAKGNQVTISVKAKEQVTIPGKEKLDPAIALEVYKNLVNEGVIAP